MPPLSHLELEYIDGRLYLVTKDFLYNVSGIVVRVPAGFKTDFASIPRILWNILPPTGNYGEAAVVHDYLYVAGGHVPNVDHIFTKKEADQMFRTAMKELEVPWYQQYPMYLAVRWFGRGSF